MLDQVFQFAFKLMFTHSRFEVCYPTGQKIKLQEKFVYEAHVHKITCNCLPTSDNKLGCLKHVDTPKNPFGDFYWHVTWYEHNILRGKFKMNEWSYQKK